MPNHLHIVSFDIPYPANYGGVIDVFHKIRCLNKQGVKVILHCFEYGDRKRSPELETLCSKVYYYQRNTSFINQFSLLPFNVKSRISNTLKTNLLQDNYPILFEVLHTCYLLDDPDFKHRKKIFRHSNIEHHYFLELAKVESSFLKKIYLKIEAFKLKLFEKRITKADVILCVSETDLVYFKQNYPNTPSVYLPSFHQFDEIQSKIGKGDYILYHGNLSVSENYKAALWLIDNVFSKITFPIVIAGLNPPTLLVEAVKKHKHITLKQNCTEQEMQLLIENAHIHCLYTQQATGLKLKLLNVLYSGRFVIVNDQMLIGTSLVSITEVCNLAENYISKINELLLNEFDDAMIEQRTSGLLPMNNNAKTKTLLQI